MPRRRSTLCLLVLINLSLGLAAPGRAADTLGPEMLVNGSLAAGVNGWTLETNEGASAGLSVIEKGCGDKPALAVAVRPSTSDKLYTVQLTQKELVVKKGKTYRLTFQAKSDPAVWFFVTLAGASPPHAPLTKGSQVEAASDWRPFSYDLVATEDSSDARIVFTNLNVAGATRSIADLSLRPVEAAAP